MNKFYKGYDSIQASDAFKSHLVLSLQNETKEEPAVRVGTGVRTKRRAFIAVLATAVLVLAIGTAVAVGVSTVGRMKEQNEARMEMTEDARYEQARAEAIRRMNSVVWEYAVPLNETVTLDDVTLTLLEASYEDVTGNLKLTFAAKSEQTGMVLTFDPAFLDGDLHTQRIIEAHDTFCAVGTDAVDFRLTVNGTDYAPYHWDDPPIAAGFGENDTFLMWFYHLGTLENGTSMTLSGTLCRYDRQGTCTGEIGTFSIPFVYDYTDELREAEIDRLTRAIITEMEHSDSVQQAVLSPLPNESTPLGEQTAAFTTFHDVTADERGILLGFTNRWGGEYGGTGSVSFQYFCIDGYLVNEERVAVEWAKDFTWETNLMRLPFYASRKNLPDVVTVACVNLSGRSQKAPEGEGWIEPETYDEAVFVFRYDLNTGAVTLPKDDAERDAWFTPLSTNKEEAIREVISHCRYEVIDVQNVSDEQNGVPVQIHRIAFGQDGSLSIVYSAQNMACEVMTWETYPKEILLNGEAAERYFARDWNWTEEPYRLSDKQIADIIDTYSMEKTRHIVHDFQLTPPKRLDMYDGPITIEIKDWELYDLNKQGERVYIGTYSFTFTVDPADAYAFVGVPYEGIKLILLPV